ncbi:MAG: hypothetical protein M1822_002469 [Bathelium mastoideum]|nr:MAG: hypothetical protein M1822_002469 [Bathelium mastoideum]
MGGGEHKERILFTLPFPEPSDVLSKLRKQYPAYSFTWYSTSDSAAPSDLFKPYTILITLELFPHQPSSAPQLKWIQRFKASGTAIANAPIFRDTDILLTTVSGIHGPQIAEWTVMSTLVLNHAYKQLYELQKRHRWGKFRSDEERPAYQRTRDLVGQRLGVLGYGSIGRQVARAAHAMGMHVLAYTATPKTTPESRRDRGFIVPGTGDPEGTIPDAWFSGLERASLREFLAQRLDVLLVSVPLTKDTERLLGREEFEVLGKHGEPPLLVNIARGKILDQDALITALKKGVLRGAALDVTDPEPLPSDSELWDMENVIVTPHVSGSGVAYTQRALALLDENLKRWDRGEKLLNVVQRDRGY